MKKYALVLSGGGFLGAFQLGALQYLNDHWHKVNPDNPSMKFDIVAGVSVGALNGLLVASDRMDELSRHWEDVANNGVEEIYTSDFIDTRSQKDTVQLKLDFAKIKNHLLPNLNLGKISLWKWLGILFSRNKEQKIIEKIGPLISEELKKSLPLFKSLTDNTPLKVKLHRLAKRDLIKHCIFKCGYVSLDSGQYYSINHSEFLTDEDFANGVLASTIMPIVFPPVRQIQIGNNLHKNLVDGGVRNVSPLGDVIREIKKDEDHDTQYTIIVINCSNGQIKEEVFDDKNIAQIALRSLADITITEIFNHDIKEYVDKNYILKQIHDLHPEKVIYDYDMENDIRGKPLRIFETIIIQPDERLGDSLVANRALIDRRLMHGKKKAKDAIDAFISPARDLDFALA